MRFARRAATGILAAAALTAVPAAAQASTAVLQVDRAHHALRTVDTTTKQVRSAHYRGRLSRNVRPGSLIRAARSGTRLRTVRSVGTVRGALEVPGTVLATGPTGTTVGLSDGRPLSVSLTVNGLQEGQAVDVALRFTPEGGVSITITLHQADPGQADDGEDPVDTEEEDAPAPDCVQDGVRGRITGVNRVKGVFSLARTWDDEQTFAAGAPVLAGLVDGSIVLVHLADGHADRVTTLPNAHLAELDGTVVRISDDAEQITIAPKGGGARVSLDASCWVRESVTRAEDVHLVVHTDASGDLVVDAVDANDGTTL